MAREVVFRPRAAGDLDNLYDHIAEHSPERAIAFIRRIRQRCHDVAAFPLVGRARDDIRPGLRLLAFEKRVVIAYAVTTEQVAIIRVFYGGQDVDALLDEAGTAD